ncbi:hypothetical protein [Pedobacter duraquae]|uniref:Lipoprotein n=1 Tax=Pedobacter duraquae TaxID=425511 RepID=A0A4V3C479_9SPHI|nr:hypothetical protein [Pedobacter duraquae]TDO24958.1 hypothetical protein CLV32_1253 [Pedobacter duraquae]
MRKYFAILLFSLAACNNPQDVKPVAGAKNFDLVGYFDAEAKRLDVRSPVILKSVWINGKQETKSIKIKDWKKELSIFTDADINKRAWDGEFKKSESATFEQYSTENEKIPVKKVLIWKKSEKICGLKILIRNSNYLYTSTDTLSYYPDSLYQIKKMQQIRFMKSKHYQILGRF